MNRRDRELYKRHLLRLTSEIYEILPRNDMLILVGDYNAKISKEEALGPNIERQRLHETSSNNFLRLAELAASQNLPS